MVAVSEDQVGSAAWAEAMIPRRMKLEVTAAPLVVQIHNAPLLRYP